MIWMMNNSADALPGGSAFLYNGQDLRMADFLFIAFPQHMRFAGFVEMRA